MNPSAGLLRQPLPPLLPLVLPSSCLLSPRQGHGSNPEVSSKRLNTEAQLSNSVEPWQEIQVVACNSVNITSYSTPKLQGYSFPFPSIHAYILMGYRCIMENICIYFHLNHGKGY
ncbi:Nuclear Receptor Coactivator 2 [Manis pentadactyla]|nr:Nuclear Receptor Coactivator 2 [Manis pentadactyla]